MAPLDFAGMKTPEASYASKLTKTAQHSHLQQPAERKEQHDLKRWLAAWLHLITAAWTHLENGTQRHVCHVYVPCNMHIRYTYRALGTGIAAGA